MNRSARWLAALFVLASSAATHAAAKADPITPLLLATAGQWSGELQYRDYESNRWEGLPMTVEINAQPDGAVLLRTAAFDDGPQTGTVWITTTSLYDAASGTESYAILRKGRAADSGTRRLTLTGTPHDPTHWTIVAEETRKDGDSLAQVRETTTRDGAVMTTLKEVNPEDDGKDVWLPRNRTVLRRTGA